MGQRSWSAVGPGRLVVLPCSCGAVAEARDDPGPYDAQGSHRGVRAMGGESGHRDSNRLGRVATLASRNGCAPCQEHGPQLGHEHERQHADEREPTGCASHLIAVCVATECHFCPVPFLVMTS